MSLSTTESYDHTTETPQLNDDIKAYFLHFLCIFTVLVIFLMSFMERRKSFGREKCNGLPGVIIPLNMLDDYDNRWIYMFCYGGATNAIMNALQGFSSEIYGFKGIMNTYLKVITKAIIGLEMCVLFYPMFASVALRHRLIGSLIGFVWSGAWFALMLLATLGPVDSLGSEGIRHTIVYLPTALCMMIVWCVFTLSLIKNLVRNFNRFIRKIQVNRESKSLQIAHQWQLDYTTALFNTKQRIETMQESNSKNRVEKYLHLIKNLLMNKVLDGKTKFSYSTRMICCLFIVLSCTYQFAVAYFVQVADVSAATRNYSEFFLNVSTSINWSHNTTVPFIYEVLKITNMIMNTFSITLQIMSILSAVLFVVNLLFILIKYRRDMIGMYKGETKLKIPSSVLKHNGRSVVFSSMTFTGYQIAYMIWGYVIVNLVLGIVTFIICVFLGLIYAKIYKLLYWTIQIAIIPLIFTIILHEVEDYIVSYFFQQNKHNPSDKHRPLALDNIKAFHITTYFMVIANVTIGLFSCVFRVMKSVIIGLVFFGRLDRCVLIPGFESWDTGYTSYIGMLYMEHNHNNPVMRSFCHLLLETAQLSSRDHKSAADSCSNRCSNSCSNSCCNWTSCFTIRNRGDIPRQRIEEDEESQEEETRRPGRQSLARRRWYLAFTLLRNTQLVIDRRKDALNYLDTSSIEGVQLETLYQQYAILKQAVEKLEMKLFKSNKLHELTTNTLTDDSLGNCVNDVQNIGLIGLENNHRPIHISNSSEQFLQNTGTSELRNEIPVFGVVLAHSPAGASDPYIGWKLGEARYVIDDEGPEMQNIQL